MVEAKSGFGTLIVLGLSACLVLILAVLAAQLVAFTEQSVAVVENASVNAQVSVKTGYVLPPLCPHAVEKHGGDAAVSYNWITQHATNCRWSDCPDGADHYVCEMSPGRWAVLIGNAKKVFTAFVTTNPRSAATLRAGCKNPWNYAHP